MKCDFKLHMMYKGDEITLFITEIDYSPAQVQTYHQEGWPEILDVTDGYVLNSEGKEVDILDEVLDSKAGYISDDLLNFYHKEGVYG